ncbi:hypothetical protein DIPPA_27776 [Diplonema papillatum]|nr:hypothetical protein DIPPA_27776 [Diplonema papillatum]
MQSCGGRTSPLSPPSESEALEALLLEVHRASASFNRSLEGTASDERTTFRTGHEPAERADCYPFQLGSPVDSTMGGTSLRYQDTVPCLATLYDIPPRLLSRTPATPLLAVSIRKADGVGGAGKEELRAPAGVKLDASARAFGSREAELSELLNTSPPDSPTGESVLDTSPPGSPVEAEQASTAKGKDRTPSRSRFSFRRRWSEQPRAHACDSSQADPHAQTCKRADSIGHSSAGDRQSLVSRLATTSSLTSALKRGLGLVAASADGEPSLPVRAASAAAGGFRDLARGSAGVSSDAAQKRQQRLGPLIAIPYVRKSPEPSPAPSPAPSPSPSSSSDSSADDASLFGDDKSSDEFGDLTIIKAGTNAWGLPQDGEAKLDCSTGSNQRRFHHPCTPEATPQRFAVPLSPQRSPLMHPGVILPGGVCRVESDLPVNDRSWASLAGMFTETHPQDPRALSPEGQPSSCNDNAGSRNASFAFSDHLSTNQAASAAETAAKSRLSSDARASADDGSPGFSVHSSSCFPRTSITSTYTNPFSFLPLAHNGDALQPWSPSTHCARDSWGGQVDEQAKGPRGQGDTAGDPAGGDVSGFGSDGSGEEEHGSWVDAVCQEKEDAVSVNFVFSETDDDDRKAARSAGFDDDDISDWGRDDGFLFSPLSAEASRDWSCAHDIQLSLAKSPLHPPECRPPDQSNPTTPPMPTTALRRVSANEPAAAFALPAAPSPGVCRSPAVSPRRPAVSLFTTSYRSASSYAGGAAPPRSLHLRSPRPTAAQDRLDGLAVPMADASPGAPPPLNPAEVPSPKAVSAPDVRKYSGVVAASVSSAVVDYQEEWTEVRFSVRVSTANDMSWCAQKTYAEFKRLHAACIEALSPWASGVSMLRIVASSLQKCMPIFPGTKSLLNITNKSRTRIEERRERLDRYLKLLVEGPKSLYSEVEAVRSAIEKWLAPHDPSNPCTFGRCLPASPRRRSSTTSPKKGHRQASRDSSFCATENDSWMDSSWRSSGYLDEESRAALQSNMRASTGGNESMRLYKTQWISATKRTRAALDYVLPTGAILGGGSLGTVYEVECQWHTPRDLVRKRYLQLVKLDEWLAALNDVIPSRVEVFRFLADLGSLPLSDAKPRPTEPSWEPSPHSVRYTPSSPVTLLRECKCTPRQMCSLRGSVNIYKTACNHIICVTPPR